MTDVFWMAPMHGITHFPFRNAFLQHFSGVDAVMAPFISAQEYSQHSLSSKADLFPENNPAKPVVPQIMGTEAAKIVDTINYLSQSLHYQQFNWNIGCPMKNIVRKNRGCGMMRFPEQVEQVVESVCANTNVRFSVKMRIGMETPAQGIEIIERLNNYPLDFVVIHPRYGTQLYDGVVNLQQFDEMYERCQHQIVYSGDLGLANSQCTSKQFFQHLKQRYPKINNWMVGRGMLWDPFIFTKLKNKAATTEPSVSSFFVFYDTLKNTLLTVKNERIMLGIVKELWKYFAYFLQLDEALLLAILRAQTAKELYEIESFIKKTKKTCK